MTTYTVRFRDGSASETIEADHYIVLDSSSGSMRFYIKTEDPNEPLEAFFNDVRSIVPIVSNG